jgi:ethanolamine ammonia-lyase small subunit
MVVAVPVGLIVLPEPKMSALLPDDGADEVVRAIRDRSPARLLVGRAGTSYRTETLLGLRVDHAAAVDAVRAELDLDPAFVVQWGMVEVTTLAATKAEYLMRPDLGRRIDPAGLARLAAECPSGVAFQVAIADGLSALAVAAQVPLLLPGLADGAARLGWTFGRPILVRHGRVGILNDIGDALGASVVVLLIGERPGLATAESLSAYLAYRPRAGQNDAHRNLISNVHPRGTSHAEASARILRLAEQMMRLGTSGVAIKEDSSEVLPGPYAP